MIPVGKIAVEGSMERGRSEDEGPMGGAYGAPPLHVLDVQIGPEKRLARVGD